VGLADDVGAPDDDGVAALEGDVVEAQGLHDAGGRAGATGRQPEVEAPHVDRVEAVDVLVRIDRCEHGVAVDLIGERQLHEDAVHGVVGVELPDGAEHGLLRRLPRQAHHPPGQAERLRGLLLLRHVDLRGGVVADEKGDQAGRPARALRESGGATARALLDALGDHLAAQGSGDVCFAHGWVLSAGSRVPAQFLSG
jgi:hypothetical protein